MQATNDSVLSNLLQNKIVCVSVGNRKNSEENPVFSVMNLHDNGCPFIMSVRENDSMQEYECFFSS